MLVKINLQRYCTVPSLTVILTILFLVTPEPIVSIVQFSFLFPVENLNIKDSPNLEEVKCYVGHRCDFSCRGLLWYIQLNSQTYQWRMSLAKLRCVFLLVNFWSQLKAEWEVADAHMPALSELLNPLAVSVQTASARENMKCDKNSLVNKLNTLNFYYNLIINLFIINNKGKK